MPQADREKEVAQVALAEAQADLERLRAEVTDLRGSLAASVEERDRLEAETARLHGVRECFCSELAGSALALLCNPDIQSSRSCKDREKAMSGFSQFTMVDMIILIDVGKTG